MNRCRRKIGFNQVLFILLFVTAFLFGCKDNKPEETRTKYVIPDSLLKTLTIDSVQNCPLVNVVKLTGMVDFNQDKQANIYSLVSGNIQDIKVQLGDYVRRGQVLAIVKSSEMAGYSYNLTVAEGNVKTAKKQLEAANELYKSGLSSMIEVTNAQANYAQAVSQLGMARRVLKINGSRTNGDYIVRSPVSGFVVQKNVTNGTIVRADNNANLFTVADLSDVWVEGNVYEADAQEIHVGDQAEVKILSAPDKVFTGKVDKIMNVLDPTTKVIKVRVVIKNPNCMLKPQMYASVMVANPEGRRALCIPSKALVYDRSRYYVLVYKGKGNADIVPVEVLNNLGDRTYIRSGVREGDRVISSLALQIYSELNN